MTESVKLNKSVAPAENETNDVVSTAAVPDPERWTGDGTPLKCSSCRFAWAGNTFNKANSTMGENFPNCPECGDELGVRWDE